MAQIYIPNPTAALPTPRPNPPPQSNTMTNALSAGLTSLTQIAETWRDKQNTVAQAEKMASLLEAEGMQSEANLYRGAASAYSTNFFADAAANKKANQSILSDALKLLESKQDRELKMEEAKARTASYASSDLYHNALAKHYENTDTTKDEKLALDTATRYENEAEAASKRQQDYLSDFQRGGSPDDKARVAQQINNLNEEIRSKREAAAAIRAKFLPRDLSIKTVTANPPPVRPEDLTTKSEVQAAKLEKNQRLAEDIASQKGGKVSYVGSDAFRIAYPIPGKREHQTLTYNEDGQVTDRQIDTVPFGPGEGQGPPSQSGPLINPNAPGGSPLGNILDK